MTYNLYFFTVFILHTHTHTQQQAEKYTILFFLHNYCSTA